MTDIFDQFDTEIDVKQLAEDVAAAQANDGKYEEPPSDVYEVKITYMGVGKSKTEKPMAKVTFEIVAGDLKGRRIYMNQVILQKFQVKGVNIFLDSLKTGIPVVFTTYREYNKTMLDIKGVCDERELTFQLNFSKDKKGYNTFTIEDVFEDIPF